MAYMKRRIVTALSAILLIALTVVAGYALHSIRYYSLPIPTILGALTVGLPAIVGLTTEFTTQFRRQPLQLTANQSKQPKGNQVSIAVYILVILEAVIATLAGAHLTPDSNVTCGLETEWRRLFRAKSRTIERIQDALRCCGLHSTADMAYPFPAKGVGANACITSHNRHISCFDGLEIQQRKAAGIILGVAVVVAIWQILIVTDPLDKENISWLHEILPGRSNAHRDGQRTIGYAESEQYQDDPEAGTRVAGDLAGAVPTHSTPRSRDAPVSPVLSSRMHPSGLGRVSEEGWGQSD